MNNRPKGNHKHLTLSDRIIIERGLANGESFRTIARQTGKDPSTISKEVRLHSYYPERRQSSFAPIPCAHNYNASKPKAHMCQLRHICGNNECKQKCIDCREYRCVDICEYFEVRRCDKLLRPPYVCNSCTKQAACLMQRRMYSAKAAQDSYKLTLYESREGINQTPDRIQAMDDIVSPLIKKGQSISHIYATHADDLQCSKRTIYTYIDKGVFSVINMDLRRKVRYKPRKKKTETPIKNRLYRQDHTYKDFLEYVTEKQPEYVIELDTVEGNKESTKCLLTMLFRNCNLMLVFLLNDQTQEEVVRVFDELTALLGIKLFKKLFPCILTDNGHEFTFRERIECDENGEIRTKVFYCDPRHSEQKGALEKNHEYIRYVLPKGVYFDNLTEKKVLLLMNHINSEKRDSLNGHSPYEVSRILLDNRLHEALGLKEIPADDVTLVPELLK